MAHPTANGKTTNCATHLSLGALLRDALFGDGLPGPAGDHAGEEAVERSHAQHLRVVLQPLDVRPQHRRPEARVVKPELIRQLLGEIGIYRVTNKNQTRLCSNIARFPIVVVALGHRAAGQLHQWNLERSVCKTYCITYLVTLYIELDLFCSG